MLVVFGLGLMLGYLFLNRKDAGVFSKSFLLASFLLALYMILYQDSVFDRYHDSHFAVFFYLPLVLYSVLLFPEWLFSLVFPGHKDSVAKEAMCIIAWIGLVGMVVLLGGFVYLS